MRLSHCLDRPQCFAPARTGRTAQRAFPRRHSRLLLCLVLGSLGVACSSSKPAPSSQASGGAGGASGSGGTAASGATVGSGGRDDGGNGGGSGGGGTGGTNSGGATGTDDAAGGTMGTAGATGSGGRGGTTGSGGATGAGGRTGDAGQGGTIGTAGMTGTAGRGGAGGSTAGSGGIGGAAGAGGTGGGGGKQTPPDAGSDRAPGLDAAVDAGSREASADVEAPTPSDGGGGMAPAGRCASVYLGATESTHAAIAADVDGDGRLDVVTGVVYGQIGVFRQTAPRTFADPDLYALSNLYPNKMTAADLNEDGFVDLAVADGYNEVGLLLSGPGGFTPAVFDGPQSGDLEDIAIADLDGDGHLDIAVAHYDTGTLGIMWATGPGAFLPRVDQTVCTEPIGVSVIDANEDRRPDLVVGCYNTASRLLINDGGRSFTTSAFYNTFGAAAMATGDLNNDGHVDIVIADQVVKELIVMLGDGQGGFTQPTGLITAIQSNLASAAMGDFDHDGNQDLALGYVNDPRVLLYFGTGDGHFRTGQPTPVPITWTAINLSVADVDGDGNDDLVATDWAKGATVVFGPCP